jgi:hypothetical protein
MLLKRRKLNFLQILTCPYYLLSSFPLPSEQVPQLFHSSIPTSTSIENISNSHPNADIKKIKVKISKTILPTHASARWW